MKFLLAFLIFAIPSLFLEGLAIAMLVFFTILYVIPLIFTDFIEPYILTNAFDLLFLTIIHIFFFGCLMIWGSAWYILPIGVRVIVSAKATWYLTYKEKR